MKRLKRYDEIFDLTDIEDNHEDNTQMVDRGIIGCIESAMMDRMGRKVRVVITVCKNHSE
jgi:hypothetical protein